MTSLDEIRHAVREVAGDLDHVLAVYLFGSQLHADTHDASDVDLGILFTDPQPLAEVIRLQGRFEERLGQTMDLVDVGSCDPYLALRIVQGERLHSSDEVRTDEFDLYVLRRAGDLEPFERERRQMALER